MFNEVTNDQMLQDCFKIRKEVFVKEQHVPEDNEIDKYENEAIHIIGYNEDNLPIATARIRMLNEEIGKVERVAILKEYRGLGLGLKLLQFVKKIAHTHQLTFLTMHAQYYAIPFYEKLGYSTSGEPFYEENIKHIVMDKNMNT